MKQSTSTAICLAASMVSTQLFADNHTLILPDEIKWGLLNPARGQFSPKASDLWGNRTKAEATGMLVRFDKGFESPPHIHNITYRGVVIEGEMHNDDPAAENMWLPAGSFWIQPAGESHVTAANGQTNLIYLEIDNGPYLVLSSEQAFDNGERPVNISPVNLVWLTQNEAKWVEKANNAKIAYLWGNTDQANGSFVKLSAGFKGSIGNDNGLKVVVIEGSAEYRWQNDKKSTLITPSSFFSSKQGRHHLQVQTPLLLYVHANKEFRLE